MSHKQLAETIWKQLGGNMFNHMTGSHSYSFSERDGKKGLSFKLRRNKSKANHMIISYDEARDTYVCEFVQCSLKVGFVVLKKVDDVYCDMLQDIFSDFTGMATTMAG